MSNISTFFFRHPELRVKTNMMKMNGHRDILKVLNQIREIFVKTSPLLKYQVLNFSLKVICTFTSNYKLLNTKKTKYIWLTGPLGKLYECEIWIYNSLCSITYCMHSNIISRNVGAQYKLLRIWKVQKKTSLFLSFS